MIDKALMGFMAASYGVGKPIVKGLKFIKKKSPKSIKKFDKKTNKIIKNEFKEMKSFAKDTPEMFAGSIAIGAGTSYATKKTYQKITNKKKG